ncbi:predicted protein [Lichtheimia corymbifera JMRC:FSU:9682]|uniref:Uncharacterized protein n=2 Tax=Lichtheimia TaxID=688353 RepID=A0A068RZ60_9FUNG|nr:uncharacterized protein O0I10_004599 [Lichtheimia ornata]KAJ8659620.1 hypothetical protein O0I10_004599 [Lichtheimia ornata]CDH55294.1 predicted protein [Lichtheimia corymbifera JMRC:FSU:9682]
MATPSTNEVLFVVIVVILFFFLLGGCVYCIYKATGPRKKQMTIEQQQQLQQQQYYQHITATQLESLRPPELAKQLNSDKRRSILDKFMAQPTVNRPSSMREPSFLPMHQSIAARDAQIAAMVSNQPPPPAYGDYRSSVRVDVQHAVRAPDEKH